MCNRHGKSWNSTKLSTEQNKNTCIYLHVADLQLVNGKKQSWSDDGKWDSGHGKRGIFVYPTCRYSGCGIQYGMLGAVQSIACIQKLLMFLIACTTVMILITSCNKTKACSGNIFSFTPDIDTCSS